MIKISNPTYDPNFKNLFGPNGLKIDEDGPRERLLSLLKQIYPNEIIDFVEYLETYNELANSKKNIFDISCKCKCYNDTGECIFDIEIQRILDDSYVKRTLMYATRLFHTNTIKEDSFTKFPQIRVLSFLCENLDDKKPSIIHHKIMIPNSKKVLSEAFLWTFVQLPKLLKEGTNQKWLQILSAGVPAKRQIQIDASEFTDGVYQSGLKLLEASRSRKQYQRLSNSSFDRMMVKASMDALNYYGQQDSYIESVNFTNHNLIQNVLNLAGRFPLKDIPTILSVDIEVVNFIVLTSLFWEQYLQKNYPTDDNLEEEIQNFFKFANFSE